MSKKSEQHETARESIVRSAFETFGKYGFHGTSTREVARQAGVSQGLLTYHFKTKIELWRAAVDYIFGLLKEDMNKNMDTSHMKDASEIKREEIRQFVRFAAEYPELNHFMIKLKDDQDGRLQWLLDNHLKSLYAMFNKDFSDIPEHMMPHIFYATVGAASLIFAVGDECKQLTGLDPHSKKAIETHADFIARLFIP